MTWRRKIREKKNAKNKKKRKRERKYYTRVEKFRKCGEIRSYGGDIT